MLKRTVKSSMTSTLSISVRNVAAAGLGAALAERRLVEQDLAEGRLIAPLGFVTIEGGFQASVTPRARERRATAAFLTWLTGEVGKG